MSFPTQVSIVSSISTPQASPGRTLRLFLSCYWHFYIFGTMARLYLRDHTLFQDFVNSPHLSLLFKISPLIKCWLHGRQLAKHFTALLYLAVKVALWGRYSYNSQSTIKKTRFREVIRPSQGPMVKLKSEDLNPGLTEWKATKIYLLDHVSWGETSVMRL